MSGASSQPPKLGSGLVTPSSFQRKTNPGASSSVGGLPTGSQRPGPSVKANRLPLGTKPSLYTHHVLVSSGIEDLDNLLGGGIPVGSSLLIFEDEGGGYAKLLLKYFLSEGLRHKNCAFIASLSSSAENVANNLPSWDTDQNQDNQNPSTQTTINKDDNSSDQMKIAWRYQNIPSNQHSPSKSNGYASFNLLKTVPKQILGECELVTWPGSGDVTANSSDGSAYTRLLSDLHKTAIDRGVFIDADKPVPNLKGGERPNVLRVGLLSLGDILWWNEDENEMLTDILSFLLGLRGLLRSSICSAVITVPHSLHSNENIRKKLLSVVDYCVSVKSFAGETVNPAYKDYHGIFRVEKIASLGVLTPPPHLLQDENELVFRSRRTGFKIERFHLPPDLSSTVSRDTKDPKLKPTTSGGANPGGTNTRVNIDF